MRILVLDNYDSFTYNLVHLLKEITDAPIDIIRNDKISLNDIKKYDKIILSPGPGIPDEAGIMLDVIKLYAPTRSILGVCLGHQGICQAFDAKLVNMTNVCHGISDNVKLLGNDKLFEDLGSEIKVGRYHSWIVSKENFPNCLEITAEDSKGQIMAVKHKKYNIRGVQFHPESVLTPKGKEIIKNWLIL